MPQLKKRVSAPSSSDKETGLGFKHLTPRFLAYDRTSWSMRARVHWSLLHCLNILESSLCPTGSLEIFPRRVPGGQFYIKGRNKPNFNSALTTVMAQESQCCPTPIPLATDTDSRELPPAWPACAIRDRGQRLVFHGLQGIIQTHLQTWCSEKYGAFSEAHPPFHL